MLISMRVIRQISAKRYIRAINFMTNVVWILAEVTNSNTTQVESIYVEATSIENQIFNLHSLGFYNKN